MLKLKKYSGGEQVVQILKENWEKNLTEKWDPFKRAKLKHPIAN